MLASEDSIIFRNKSPSEKNQKLNFLLAKNPNKVPLIFEKHPDSSFYVADRNIKFFADPNIKFSKFRDTVRQLWNLNEEETLFFSCGKNEIINPDKFVGDLYKKYKSEDGFLYVSCNNVKTLG
jgi:hypothetical protein